MKRTLLLYGFGLSALGVPVENRTRATETAVFAGGCFWGIEAVYEHVKGVKVSESGYSGGKLANPSYDEVSAGITGHAESVRIVFDPAIVSYRQLLSVFFRVAHDPTQLNRQGPDVGTQYRSAIYYASESQRADAQAFIDSLTKAKVYRRPIVTEVKPLAEFYVAEPYHQDYLARHPTQMYIVINDAPKLVALEKEFPALWRK